MKEELYRSFDAYLQGELEGKDLALFEGKLVGDSEFKKDFQAYSEVEKSLKSRLGNVRQEQALRATLNKLRTQEKGTPKGLVFNLKKYVWIGVAASLLVLFSVYVFKDAQVPRYIEYAMHQPLEIGDRGTDNSLSEAAVKAFNEKDYARAVKELRMLTASNPQHVEWQLYYGISLIETDKIATAVTILGSVASGSSGYKYTAQWYTALGYLKAGKIDWCKGVLEEMPVEAAIYEKAQELLDRL
ncbi:MAG: hypothetical protein JKY08_09785 [Flavobacteriaceae bacterium]|nr:hypothetical protein [Flavobacteriaceae bacterium]